MGKRNSEFRLSFTRDHEKLLVTVNVMEGEEVAATEVFDFNKVPAENRARLYVYGGSQFLSDRASETETGPAKLTEMKEVFDMLVKGEWAKARERGAPTVAVEIEALSRHYKSSIAEAQTTWRGLSKEQREKVAAHPAIAALIVAVKEERATAPATGLDVGALLA